MNLDRLVNSWHGCCFQHEGYVASGQCSKVLFFPACVASILRHDRCLTEITEESHVESNYPAILSSQADEDEEEGEEEQENKGKNEEEESRGNMEERMLFCLTHTEDVGYCWVHESMTLADCRRFMTTLTRICAVV